MTEDKIRITIRVTEDFYNKIDLLASKKALTVPAFTRYILKKYFNDHDKQKTNTNP